MASIKDVAQAAGVSTATVSRVLSNGLHVRPEVRERVMAAVERLGYRPNLVARSLRSQQSNTIGLIVSDISNPFFTAISRAVEDTAYEQGFSVVLCNTDENPQKEAIYLNLMRDTSVAGAIMSPTRQTIASFTDSNLPFPIAVIDRSIFNVDVDVVLLDNVDAAYRLVTHLIEQGYRRIAALCSEMSTGLERQLGYEKALRAHGLSLRSEYMRYIPPRADAGYAATLKMLDLAEPPDALFTVNSMIAEGALRAIRECNVTIPDDIALVTFDETTWASLVQPAITLIAQPTYEIGKTAAELLIQRITDPDRPTRQVILKGQLVVRGSSVPHHNNPADSPKVGMDSSLRSE
ncbi:MAG TPA: LacI family DNA-binding transcriptional regulator [Ktedonobacteraceae bacterium]|nr:LacI family DNA-binding transcriptional regulator [Ktedonobacteraceae bacterium]